MKHDPLSGVLCSVNLHGKVFYYVSCRDDWVAETPPSAALALALNPGAEHMLACHLVMHGSGWAAVEGEAPVRLCAGDIVLFPRGDAHVLSSAPGMHSHGDDSEWRITTRDDPKPIAVAFHDGVCDPGAELPTNDASTVFICSFISCDLRPFNPLIHALPRLMHLSASVVGAWVNPMLAHAVRESPAFKRVLRGDIGRRIDLSIGVRLGHGCLLSVRWNTDLWNTDLAKVCQRTHPCTMSTMNISLPDTLKSFVDEQVRQRGYGTSSEYVRELIRKDQDRLQLRNLLLAGAASAPTAEADASYFEGLRDRVRKAVKPAAKPATKA